MINKDWHSADIIAALKKKGTSLSALSRRTGYASSSLANALARPWTVGEMIIAMELDTKPELIWPSRYRNKKRIIRSRLNTNDKPRSFLTSNQK